MSEGPPRYKTVILIFVLLWPLVNTIPRLGQWIFGASALVDAASLLTVVIIMVYAAIPFGTRLAEPWLRADT